MTAIHETADAVAGLSLRSPRDRYATTDPAFGRARWSRRFHGLKCGVLELDLTPEIARRCGSQETCLVFELDSWLGRSLNRAEHGEFSGAWRSLILEHRLLSRPELIRSQAARREWAASLGPAKAEAQGQSQDIRAQAVEQLARLYSLALETGGWRCLECQACREERERAPRRSLPWGGSREDCAHARLAVAAVERFCDRFPELTFEIIDWLVPERPRSARASPERFVLARHVMEAILGRWLVGKAPAYLEDLWTYRHNGSASACAYGRSYARWHRRARRAVLDWRRLSRLKAEHPEHPEHLPEKPRLAAAFAAALWAPSTPVEELLPAWPLPTSPPPSCLPALQLAQPRLTVARVLPESAAAPPPQHPASQRRRRKPLVPSPP